MKTCPICGKPVPPAKRHGQDRIYCSTRCCQIARKRRSRELKKRLAGSERRLMIERMEKRDREWETSPYAAPVTVEERDLRDTSIGRIVTVETRGRVCVAPGSGFVNPSAMLRTA